MAKKSEAAAEAEPNLLTTAPEAAVAPADAGTASEADLQADLQAALTASQDRVVALQDELAQVTSAAETAISELKAERDGLAADKARLEGEAVEAQKLWQAAESAYQAEIDDLREANPEAAARFDQRAAEIAPEAPALHEGPFVVMKTSAIAAADGLLIARNRVATGHPDRLKSLIDDDKARRALVREVEAAQAKDSIARLA